MGCFIGRLCAGNFQLSIVKNNKNQGGCKKMSYQETYKKWCTDPYFDAQTQEELKNLEGNEKEIEDRFYRQLEFGTGGLRGMIGAGTNRMNIYTVRQATQGLANYIIAMNGQDKGVAIAHDSRIMSPEFAREAALCLNANGIHTYLFESLRPTPELSFAVRELGCIAGIVITASHNPREYNGYKVYWEDGAQITPPHDKNILAEVAKVTDFSMVKTMEEDEARAENLFSIIGTDFDDKYIAQLKKQSIHPEIIPEAAKDMKIVYTPLHGTGNIPVRRVLRELGFTQVYVVEEQKVPDGNFPTVPYPNPEDKNAWTLALELAKKVDADIILATVTLKGIDGSQKITAMMNAFRENPPKELGGFKVLACRDYKSDCRRDMITGETTSTGLPTSNVLYYELENNAWCCVRPSGTEPKIKYYFGVKGENFKDAEEKLEALKKAMTE